MNSGRGGSGYKQRRSTKGGAPRKQRRKRETQGRVGGGSLPRHHMLHGFNIVFRQDTLCFFVRFHAPSNITRNNKGLGWHHRLLLSFRRRAFFQVKRALLKLPQGIVYTRCSELVHSLPIAVCVGGILVRPTDVHNKIFYSQSGGRDTETSTIPPTPKGHAPFQVRRPGQTVLAAQDFTRISHTNIPSKFGVELASGLTRSACESGRSLRPVSEDVLGQPRNGWPWDN